MDFCRVIRAGGMSSCKLCLRRGGQGGLWGPARDRLSGAEREVAGRAPRATARWVLGARGIDRMQAVYRQSFILGTDWREVDETCEHSSLGHRRRGKRANWTRNAKAKTVPPQGAAWPIGNRVRPTLCAA